MRANLDSLQSAEALLRRIDSEHFEALSAGPSPGGLHPLTVEVMNEIGIDLTQNIPRCLEQLTDETFDYVITLGERTFHHTTISTPRKRFTGKSTTPFPRRMHRNSN